MDSGENSGETNFSLATSRNASQNLSTARGSHVACGGRPDSPTAICFKTIALCVTMIASIAGNSAVILVVRKTKVLNNAINLFIVNMAVADLIMPVLSIPHEFVQLVSGSDEWQVKGELGLVLCKLFMILNDTSSVVSISSMVFLAVDRFCAVVLPMKRNLITGKTRTAAVVLSWILAFLYTSPYLYTLRMVKYGETEYCITDWSPAYDHVKAISIQLAIAISLFGVFPWVLVIVLYAVMIVEIKKSKRAANISSRSRKKRGIDVRVLRLALAIVLAFALCYFPMSSMYLVVAFVWKWKVCAPSYWGGLWFTSQFLIYVYTVFNPCICFAFSQNFRKGLRELVIPGRRLRKTLMPTSTNRSKTTEQQGFQLFELSEN